MEVEEKVTEEEEEERTEEGESYWSFAETQAPENFAAGRVVVGVRGSWQHCPRTLRQHTQHKATLKFLPLQLNTVSGDIPCTVLRIGTEK